MKEFKGTPGDWECNTDSDYSDTYFVKPSPTFGESYYNAKLIAAAPDLLFALQEITAHLDSIKQYSNDDYYINQAQVAITKALGE